MTAHFIFDLASTNEEKTSVPDEAHAVPKLMFGYFLISRMRLDLRAVFVEMSFMFVHFAQ